MNERCKTAANKVQVALHPFESEATVHSLSSADSVVLVKWLYTLPVLWYRC